MVTTPNKSLVLKFVATLAAVSLVVVGARFFLDRQPDIEFQKGMGYVTWSSGGYLTPQSDESLERMADLGTEWVSILVTWYQTTAWSNDIRKTGDTPSDESIRHVIREAKDLGMKVMLKPHLDIIDTSDGSWRGEIGASSEQEWEDWFDQYEDYLNHYVKIANQENVEMICIGTELSSSATVKGYMWREMIDRLRQSYKGKLTYAAHWDVYRDIRFWDLLDYVGINAYFPLTKKMEPTYEELIEGWKRWIPEIEEFQKRVDKPIIFPEVGTTSARGAAIRPWEHHPRTEVNLELQADYFEALYETFWEKDWFYGLYWWYWGTNVNMGGVYDRGFTPQNKPSEDIIDAWYDKSNPRK